MKNYGFQRPKIEENNYLGGVLGNEIVNEKGDWTDYLPTYEPQFNEYYDSYGCTVWGALNQIETFLKQITGTEFNFSERFIYILAKVTPPGANPHTIYETIRKNGLLDDQYLPMLPTYKDFLKPNPMSEVFLKKGKEFIEDFEFKHEWLWGDSWKSRTYLPEKKKLLKEYLKYSPLAISVTAWSKDGNEYVDRGMANTHWCELYKIDSKGRLHVFDSYDQSTKILAKDHNIEFAKRISLKRKELTKSRFTYLMERLYSFLPKLWKS